METLDLQTLFNFNVFSILLVFSRIGSVFLFMPILGTNIVPVRIRLVFAFLVSLVSMPAVVNYLPVEPDSVVSLVLLLLREILIGSFFGLLAMIIMTVFHTAGTVISFNIQIANALIDDPITRQQGSIVTSFLLQVANIIFLISGLFDLFLKAVIESYGIFEPSKDIIMGDFSKYIMMEVAHAFSLGVKFAMPFVILGVGMQFSIGIINRLAQQLQLYFVAMPLNILIGIVFIMFMLPVYMTVLFDYMKEAISKFVP